MNPSHDIFNPHTDLKVIKFNFPKLYHNYSLINFPFGFIPILCVFNTKAERIVYCEDAHRSVYYPSRNRLEVGNDRKPPWSDTTYEEALAIIFHKDIPVKHSLCKDVLRYTKDKETREKIQLLMLDTLI